MSTSPETMTGPKYGIELNTPASRAQNLRPCEIAAPSDLQQRQHGVSLLPVLQRPV
jgi:hypothetical protein